MKASLFRLPHLRTALTIAACLAVVPTPVFAAFTFGTVGDHGSGSATSASFRGAGAANLNFFLSLGDLSYSDPALLSENQWCQFVKDNLNAGAGYGTGNSYGESYPVEIISGNHESDLTQNNGLIDNFVAPGCLPNRMGQAAMSPNLGTNPHPTTGNYAKEYYFDYPSSSPLARFIMASPGQNFLYGGTYSYVTGNARYQWLSGAIDGARAAGIRWVIVANHKNYISTGNKANELGPDYFNLLVSKKVDLILEGHDHTYQRSKQLGFRTGCTSITTGTADVDCIVDDGSDNTYTKAAGSVLLITGNGGKGFYSTSSGDGEAPYFAHVMSDAEQSSGYTKISVTATDLTAQFMRTGGNSFADTFTVTATGRNEDINQDGIVNMLDFSILSANYGKSGAGIKNPRADINGSGTVDLADFSRLSTIYAM